MCTNSINVHRIFRANYHNSLHLTEEETEAQDINHLLRVSESSSDRPLSAAPQV